MTLPYSTKAAPQRTRRFVDRTFSCAVELSLSVLDGKWKPVILAHLKQGPLRYGELRARIPKLSDKVLTQRLKDLEALELITRDKRSHKSTYQLTPRGQSLRFVLEALHAWGMQTASDYQLTIK